MKVDYDVVLRLVDHVESVLLNWWLCIMLGSSQAKDLNG